jgi:hypothetical protein
VAPGPGQPQDKDVDGKDWHWCKHHGANGKWVRHTRDDFEIKKALEKGEGSKTIRYSAGANNKPGQMKVAAMTATFPDDDDF